MYTEGVGVENNNLKDYCLLGWIFTGISEESAGPILYPEDAPRSSRTLITIYQTTWRHLPQDSNRAERHENLKSCPTLDLISTISTLLAILTHSIFSEMPAHSTCKVTSLVNGELHICTCFIRVV
jgi:hypothetical protein